MGRQSESKERDSQGGAEDEGLQLQELEPHPRTADWSLNCGSWRLLGEGSKQPRAGLVAAATSARSGRDKGNDFFNRLGTSFTSS